MKRRLERIDESIARYMTQLETADRRGDAVPEVKVVRLRHKIVKLREEVARLSAIKAEMMKREDKQISLTDPDARSMATSGKDTGIVGYNVQAAVDTKNHLIVAHEVTNVGTDRHQLSNIAEQARAEMGVERLDAVADRGYYAGEEWAINDRYCIARFLERHAALYSASACPCPARSASEALTLG